jgi:hypothetical protein
MAGWQEEAIRELREPLEGDEGVRGLVVIGSVTRADMAKDTWSDLDVAVIVEDQAVERFCSDTAWVGDLYAWSWSESEFFRSLRAYHTDGRRIDLLLIPESSLAKIDEWETYPLAYGFECVFSRSPALDEALSRRFPRPSFKLVTREELDRLANDFWFKGMLAVSKVGRNELLVALHLSLDMIRDCLVLAMMLRDRATGTDHHRDGAHGNHFVAELESTHRPYTAEGILDSIEHSALAFDRLAAQLIEGYHPRRKTLLDLVERARVRNSPP